VVIVFPKQKIATLLMALLFSIYPGYLSMPNAETYQASLLAINFGLISLVFSLKAIENKEISIKILFLLLSGIFALLNVGIVEWFIGIEGVRISLLYYLLSKRQGRSKVSQNVLHTLAYWSPVLLGMFLFLYWRFFIFVSTRPETNFSNILEMYSSQPMLSIGHFVINTLVGFFQATIVAWVGPLWQKIMISGYSEILIAAIIGIFAICCCLIVFMFIKKLIPNAFGDIGEENVEDRWYLAGIIIGIIGVLTTIIPATFNERYIDLENTFSRYTLNSMLGVSILVVSFFYWVIRKRIIIIGLVILLIASATSTHFLNAQTYASFTARQKNFWWQFSWRVPNLINQTVFATSASLDPNYSGYWYIFPQINLIYRQEVSSIQIPTEFININSTRQILSGSAPRQRTYRTIELNYDYSKMVVATFGSGIFPNACVHVVDSNHKELTPNEDPLILSMADLSKIDLIIPDGNPVQPPFTYFGKEPEHNWCYFFEKASLALQESNWIEILNLGGEVQSRNLHPSDLSEWMPFLYAYINLGELDEAKGVASRIGSDVPTRVFICKQLVTMENNNYLTPQGNNTLMDILCNR
jgi:hypothetical protein